jgi:hypothetical protein
MKSTIYEERIETFDSELMTEEFLGLERDNNSGKIDHPDGGSKDMSDAITGAVFNASKHAEEFAFDYGETLDTIIETSAASSSGEAQKQQIQVAFEEELQKLFDPRMRYEKQIQKEEKQKEQIVAKENTEEVPKAKFNEDKPKEKFMDFGLGPAEVYKPQYIRNGIV